MRLGALLLGLPLAMAVFACRLPYGDGPAPDSGVVNQRAEDVLVIYDGKRNDGTNGTTAYLVPGRSKGDTSHDGTHSLADILVYRAADCSVLGQANLKLDGLIITIPLEERPVQFQSRQNVTALGAETLPTRRVTCGQPAPSN